MEPISLLIFSLLTLISKPALSLSLQPLPHPPSFDAGIVLLGDAEIVDGGSSVRLTRPFPSSSGLLLNKTPFRFLNPTSFSTEFSFSISPHSGAGLALVLVPRGFPPTFPGNASFRLSLGTKFLGIGFEASSVNVRSLVSSRVRNVSSLNLVMKGGVKLRAWVDYGASSKRLEIRLGEAGNARPYDPLIAFPIDLAGMWKGEEVLVGISSSSGNSSVFTWRFRVRSVPNSMHSQPVDPLVYSDHKSKRIPCPLTTIVAGLMLVIGCGALVAIMVQFLWAILVDRNALIPAAEYPLHLVDFGYEKVSVVVENSKEDVKN